MDCILENAVQEPGVDSCMERTRTIPKADTNRAQMNDRHFFVFVDCFDLKQKYNFFTGKAVCTLREFKFVKPQVWDLRKKQCPLVW